MLMMESTYYLFLHFQILGILQIVASATKGSEDFQKALEEPLYSRVREALFSNRKPTEALGLEELKIDDAHIHAEDCLVGTVQADFKDINQRILRDDPAAESPSESPPVAKGKTFLEIEEEWIEEEWHLKGDQKGDLPPISPGVMKDCNGIDLSPIDQMAERSPVNVKDVCISPKVEAALGTLENIISMVRDFGYNTQSNFLSILGNEGSNLGKDDLKRTVPSDDSRGHSNGEVCVKLSEKGTVERNLVEPRNSSGAQNSR